MRIHVAFMSIDKSRTRFGDDWYAWLLARLLPSGFQHCIIVEEYPGGAQADEWAGGRLTSKRLTVDAVNRWPPGWTIFTLDRPPAVSKRPKIRVLSCTGLVAARLGVGHGLMTPRALYERLQTCTQNALPTRP